MIEPKGETVEENIFETAAQSPPADNAEQPVPELVWAKDAGGEEQEAPLADQPKPQKPPVVDRPFKQRTDTRRTKQRGTVDSNATPRQADTGKTDDAGLPSDLALEQSVLGAILLDFLDGEELEPSGFDRAARLLTTDSFFYEAQRRIWDAMAALAESGEPVELMLVCGELKRRGQLEDLGGIEYLQALSGKSLTAVHVDRYARRVHELHSRRELIQQAADIERQARDPDADASAIASSGIGRLQHIYQVSAASPIPVSDIDAQELPDILGGTTWRYRPLLACGYLTILMGSSFVGKTVTAYRLALSEIGELPWPGSDVYVDKPGVVCWAECESGQQSIVDRIKGWELTKPGIRIAGKEGERRFSIPDDLPEIRAWLIQSKATFFVGDSFRTIFSGNENSSGEVTSALLPLAEMLRDLNIPGLLTHHTRKVQELESHVFELEKSRGSSAIYAVLRIIIAMDLPDRERETRRLFVVKSNIGPANEAWGVDLDSETGFPTFTNDVPEEPREKITTRTCKDFLVDLLGFGPAKVPDILTQGEQQGFKQRSVFAAASQIPVYRRKVSGRKGPECTWWSLTKFPEQPLFTDEESN